MPQFAFGDGRLAREASDALVEFLHQFAAPTGARGSILLMAGGLVVLAFLFFALLFRSVVVGDVAPNARRAAAFPRVSLPPARLDRRWGPDDFMAGRALGREAVPSLDAALATCPKHGLGDVRILSARHDVMRLRIYGEGEGACERTRGFLVGAFETHVGHPVKVDEVACRKEGARWCEFEARHPTREVR